MNGTIDYISYLKKFLILTGLFILANIVACSDDSGEEVKAMVQAMVNKCTQGGGSVGTDGANNCDFQAKLTAEAVQVDQAAAAGLQMQSSQVQKDCENAAQLKSVQCKFNQLVADQSNCLNAANSFVQTLNSYSQSKSEGKEVPGDLMGTLMTTMQPNAAKCSGQFQNAYLTYMTAQNGALANSKEGCKILESYVGQIARKYQGQVSQGGAGELLGLASSLKGTSSCPADTVMRMLYNQLDATAPTQDPNQGQLPTTPTEQARSISEITELMSQEPRYRGMKVYKDKESGLNLVY